MGKLMISTPRGRWMVSAYYDGYSLYSTGKVDMTLKNTGQYHDPEQREKWYFHYNAALIHLLPVNVSAPIPDLEICRVRKTTLFTVMISIWQCYLPSLMLGHYSMIGKTT
jgi:hypothetical protein